MFVKDIDTGVIHNMSETELKTTFLLRDRVKRERELISDLNDTKEDLKELKALLMNFMEGRLDVKTNS